VNVGFVTCAELGGITADDRLIASAFEDRGVDVRPVFWDAGDVVDRFDALVLRSPWNYHLTPEAFLGWIARASSLATVYNDPAIVRWNAHKGYLFELRRAGIPVPETVLCRKHDAVDLRSILTEHRWNAAVVKPAISASSFMTRIVDLSGEAVRGGHDFEERIVEDGQHHLDAILESRDALIQPFMPEILERGERCLIHIDGRFSHAVHKAPFTDAPGGGRRVSAEPEELRIAERALSVLPEVPLYARVDLLRDAGGVERLMEFELIDPELYMRFDADCPRRFTAALLRRIGGTPPS
jgi:glutathione synthase/RimK-type ligase-like ATP-grasp enzyme